MSTDHSMEMEWLYFSLISLVYSILLTDDLTNSAYLVSACLFFLYLHFLIWLACLWLSHLCSLPAVSFWVNIFPSCTFCLLQFSAPALWNSYLWLGNHSFLKEEVFFLKCPSGYSFGQGQLEEKEGRENGSVRRSLH